MQAHISVQAAAALALAIAGTMIIGFLPELLFRMDALSPRHARVVQSSSRNSVIQEMVTGKHIAAPTTGLPELSEREEIVLRSIVQHFILTATPVGSRFLSKRLEEASLSAATIRNVMADLEEKGYITHPHTSAPDTEHKRLQTDVNGWFAERSDTGGAERIS